MVGKSTIATLVVAAASFSSVVNAGSAYVHNQCSFDVYAWSVADSHDVTMQTLSAGGSSYSEVCRKNPNGGGISIKLAKSADQSQVTQFEYTTTDSTLFYDLSNINGDPFAKEGMTLTPSVSSCPSVTCAAGDSVCSQAYNNPDDVDTKGCAADADLHLYLCPNGDKSATTSPAPASRSVSVTTASAKFRRAHVHGHLFARNSHL